MAKRKHKPTKEEIFREAVDHFLVSKKKSEDYMKLMIIFHTVTRPDAGLLYEAIQRILEEKIDGKETSSCHES